MDALQAHGHRERHHAVLVGARQGREDHPARERLAAERVDAHGRLEARLDARDVELAQVDPHGQPAEIRDRDDRGGPVDGRTRRRQQRIDRPGARRAHGEVAEIEARGSEARGRGLILEPRQGDVGGRGGSSAGLQSCQVGHGLADGRAGADRGRRSCDLSQFRAGRPHGSSGSGPPQCARPVPQRPHLGLCHGQVLARCRHVCGVAGCLQRGKLGARRVHRGLGGGDLLGERRLQRGQCRERLVELELRGADRCGVDGNLGLRRRERPLRNRDCELGSRDVLRQRRRRRLLQDGEVGLGLLDLGLRRADVGRRARCEHPVEALPGGVHAILGEGERSPAVRRRAAEQRLEIRLGAPDVGSRRGQVGGVRPAGRLSQVRAGGADGLARRGDLGGRRRRTLLWVVVQLLAELDASRLEIEPRLLDCRGQDPVIVESRERLPRRDVLPRLDEQAIHVPGHVREDGVRRCRARAGGRRAAGRRPP